MFIGELHFIERGLNDKRGNLLPVLERFSKLRRKKNRKIFSMKSKGGKKNFGDSYKNFYCLIKRLEVKFVK